MSDEMMTVGQLAKRAGVTIRTLRYYDKIRLLHPTDYTEGGHRLYDRNAFFRLQQIQSLRFIGFSLKDIAELLESQHINKQDLRDSLAFKKRELLAEQEKIRQTMDQLNHMEKIILDYEEIDVKLFCFVIYSILFEEENLYESSQIKNSIHNFRSEERVHLDKEYFSLFMDLKKLVANKTNPQSGAAFQFMEQLVALSDRTLSKVEATGIKSLIQSNELNIFNPFTEEERTFLENAFTFKSERDG